MAVPLLIQLSGDAAGKATEDGLGSWVPATQLGEPDEVLAPGFGLHLSPSPSHCRHLGSETEAALYLSFCLPLEFQIFR